MVEYLRSEACGGYLNFFIELDIPPFLFVDKEFFVQMYGTLYVRGVDIEW